MRRSGGISTRRRFRILQRDGFTCQYCGRSAPSVVLHVDHLIARSIGGTDDDCNLLAACEGCNEGKSDGSAMAFPAAFQDRISEAITFMAAGGGRDVLALDLARHFDVLATARYGGCQWFSARREFVACVRRLAGRLSADEIRLGMAKALDHVAPIDALVRDARIDVVVCTLEWACLRRPVSKRAYFLRRFSRRGAEG